MIIIIIIIISSSSSHSCRIVPLGLQQTHVWGGERSEVVDLSSAAV